MQHLILIKSYMQIVVNDKYDFLDCSIYIIYN